MCDRHYVCEYFFNGELFVKCIRYRILLHGIQIFLNLSSYIYLHAEKCLKKTKKKVKTLKRKDIYRNKIEKK